MNNNNNDDYVDDLLKNLLKEVQPPQKETLKDLFDRRLLELKISQANVLVLLKMEIRTLHGILEGTQKRVDYTNLIKVANFLQLPKEIMIQLYIESLEKNFSNETVSSPKKIEFIKENFDLTTLRKAEFIDSITDFDQIERKITSFFGLNEIFDYKQPSADVAFSAGLVKPKNGLTRSMWVKSAGDYLEGLNNPYEYNRKALVDYFPHIRWHSTDVELGLTNIIRDLYKLGVTVVYQLPFSSLHLRGATFSVNDKPCIALSNYRGFYPTLWFALIHELFHVIFDWEEIRRNQYHLSDEETDELTVRAKENEADAFAREYLFSKEKTAKIRPYLNNQEYVNEFALNNHVHPSFVYVFNAYDTGNKDRMAWARAKRHNPIEMQALLNPMSNPWNNPKPISEFVKSIKIKSNLYK
ncbi:MAG TPA: ImmA/IrrE family metallo-endopeptidase [Flavobacterium sp.]|nr:ImmA/IrrE family metallo-endopeptidase [Flavobacterium sp.]